MKPEEAARTAMRAHSCTAPQYLATGSPTEAAPRAPCASTCTQTRSVSTHLSHSFFPPFIRRLPRSSTESFSSYPKGAGRQAGREPALRTSPFFRGVLLSREGVHLLSRR
ncbi:hypothetical protein BC936DRAFT_139709 [Jimgerdemannia flammicorona]|uniref:Uncharacterized protein n=1 Tax=Jimgerdemannia flammicorona TaxID=994334 RepID=A0A433B9C8_9FUNG|nr:hypothetical protein BC936DRAFT_139709 [Jimgerdemannia flammicorona]